MKICATDGCDLQTVGKSKYCREHRKAARAAWKEMIASKPTKAERDAKHAELFAKADAAGRLAADACVPVPMVVSGYEDQPIMDGVCGFAWVTVRPGNSSFAKWLKANKGGRIAYQGGMQIWISDYNQSMQRKSAYADAFAAVLRSNDVKAYGGSRMD
jgi:hypothetical protein